MRISFLLLFIYFPSYPCTPLGTLCSAIVITVLLFCCINCYETVKEAINDKCE